MRISYEKFPALRLLDENEKQYLRLHPNIVQHKDTIYNLLKSRRKDYLDINVISKRFESGAVKASASLMPLWQDAMLNKEENIEIKGTYIFNRSVCFMYINTKSNTTHCFVFHQNGSLVAFSCAEDLSKEENNYLWFDGVAFQTLLEFTEYIRAVICFSLFKTYATVETEVVNLNKKIKPEGESEPLYNAIPFPVTWLNCNWFTNIIRSQGFGVRGHFRMQPIKVNGEWTRELIWINPFQKNGYTRKATIVLNEEES